MTDAERKEKRLIAEKSFMLGVDWLLKVLADNPDTWNIDAKDASLIRARAEKVIQNYSR